MKLKAGFYFLALVAIFVWADTFYGSTPQEVVVLNTEQPSFKSGAPIKIEIILINTSNQTVTELYPMGGNAYGHFKIYVHNVNGEAVPKTPVQLGYETNREPIFGDNWVDELKPGAFEQEWAMLTDLFDLCTPGTYIVQVEQGWYDDPAVQPVLKSNPITITVTP